MSFTFENKVLWRTLVLALLFLSLLGTWSYDVINVPAEFACSYPNMRLYGDFCGMPISWLSFLFAGDFFYIFRELVAGIFTGRGRELFGLVLLSPPLLPLFSTVLLLRKKDSPRLQKFHLFAWGLGCIFPLFILFTQRDIQTFRLWGAWLYIIVAICALTLEIVIWKRVPLGNS